MQEHPSAPAPTLATVRGLGVCDALHVDFAPEQAEGLRRVLETQIAELERRIPGLTAEELPDVHHALRLLQHMRPDGHSLTGPAGLVIDLVHACFADAVDALTSRLQGGLEPLTFLDDVIRSAAAWTRTLSDCRAVERYTFEPGIDPAHAC